VPSDFRCVVRVSYSSFLTDAAEVTRAVQREVAATQEHTGASGAHPHRAQSRRPLPTPCSAVQCYSFAGPATVVSIAAPHRGVRMARWVPGSCTRLLDPAPPAVWDPPRADRSIRWITFSSDGDWWVPPQSARLPSSDPAVTNLDVPGTGHLTICRHPGLIVRLVVELLRSEWRALGAATRPGPVRLPYQWVPGSVPGLLVVPEVTRRAEPGVDEHPAPTPGADPARVTPRPGYFSNR
jgi:hypothetical protein